MGTSFWIFLMLVVAASVAAFYTPRLALGTLLKIALGVAVVAICVAVFVNHRDRQYGLGHYRSFRANDLRLLSHTIEDAALTDRAFRKWFTRTDAVSSQELFATLITNEYASATLRRNGWDRDIVDPRGRPVEIEKALTATGLCYVVRFPSSPESVTKRTEFLSWTNVIPFDQ